MNDSEPLNSIYKSEVDSNNNIDSSNMTDKNNSITTGTGNGLKGEYYNTQSFSDLKS